MRHPKYAHYNQQIFSFKELDKIHSDGALVDGRLGGLILGPSHAEGGIYFLFAYSYGFVLFGEVEGYEYVVNKNSMMTHSNRLADVNDMKRDFILNFEEYPIDNSIRTIDARTRNPDEYAARYILLDMIGGFGIINKHSTKKHLHLLNDINTLGIHG